MSYFRIATGLLLLASASLISCGVGPNLVRNGDFELIDSTSGDPEGWHSIGPPETQNFAELLLENNLSYSGRQSISVEVSSSHPDDPFFYFWTYSISKCQPNRLYVLSGWIRTRGLNEPACLLFHCTKENGGKVLGGGSTRLFFPITGTTDWTRVARIFSVPEGTEEVHIKAGLLAPEHSGGTVWFDDIQVREVY